jgi:serine protease Do
MKQIIVIVIMLVGIVLGAGLASKYIEKNNRSVLSAQPTAQVVFRSLEELQETINSIAQNTLPSVVRVTRGEVVAYEEDWPFKYAYRISHPNQGSGVVIEGGYIITNNHVVTDTTNYYVPRQYLPKTEVPKIWVKFFNGVEKEAELLGTNERYDLAMLKVENLPEGVRPARLGESSNVKVGDFVIAIGSSFGYDQTVTFGIVSGLGRKDGGIEHIQTDAAVNPGNSGGPLLNLKGNVIGINRSISSISGGFEGVGFAIPIDRFKEVKKLLATKGFKPGYLGVQVVEIDENIIKNVRDRDIRTLGDFLKKYNLEKPKGVWVVKAPDPYTPAWEAKIWVGDIIIAVDDKEIKDYNHFKSIIESSGAGNTISIKINRNGRFLEKKATLKDKSPYYPSPYKSQ